MSGSFEGYKITERANTFLSAKEQMCEGMRVCVCTCETRTSIQYFGFHYIANKLVATNRNCTPAETERGRERARRERLRRREANAASECRSVGVWTVTSRHVPLW